MSPARGPPSRRPAARASEPAGEVGASRNPPFLYGIGRRPGDRGPFFAHDPFGKPVPTFPDHALKETLPPRARLGNVAQGGGRSCDNAGDRARSRPDSRPGRNNGKKLSPKDSKLQPHLADTVLGWIGFNLEAE